MEERKVPARQTRGVIRVRCRCGKALTFRREHAGKKTRCSACKKVISIPVPGAALKIINCKNHPDARKNAACMICSAPICSLCRDTRGYFCSDACQARSRELKSDARESEADKELVEQAAATAATVFRWTRRGAIGLGVLLGLWILYALFFTTRGEIAWEVPLSGTADVRTLFEHDGALFALMSDGRLVKFDIDDGTTVGELSFNEQFGWSSIEPIRAGKDRVIVSLQGSVACVTLSDLKIAWRHRGATDGLAATERSAFLIEGYRWTPDPKPGEENKPKEPGIVCLDAASGEERWRIPRPKLMGRVQLTPGAGVLFVHEGPSYLESDESGTGDTIIAHDAGTGKPLWKAEGKFAVVADLFFHNDTVVIPTRTGLTCLNARDGAPVWKYSIPGGGSAESGVGVWAQADRLFLQLGTALTCVEMASGEPIWSIDTGGWVTDIRFDGEYLVLTGETHGAMIDDLEKGPMLTPGGDLLKDIVSKEMPDLANVKPFTAVLDPSTPSMVCVVKGLSGEPAVLGDTLLIARTKVGLALTDTSGKVWASEWSISCYELDGGEVSWQEGTAGSLAHQIFVGDMLYAVLSTPGERSDEVIKRLVAFHAD